MVEDRGRAPVAWPLGRARVRVRRPPSGGAIAARSGQVMSAPMDVGPAQRDPDDEGVSRRRLLGVGSAVAAAAWVAPQIVSTTAASAATAPPGPPPTVIAVGAGGGVFTSPDDGATWSAAI